MAKLPKEDTPKKGKKEFIQVVGDGTNTASLIFPKGIVARGKRKLAVEDVVKLLKASRVEETSEKACSWCIDNCPKWNPPCHSWVCSSLN
jgi:hypothetical protein